MQSALATEQTELVTAGGLVEAGLIANTYAGQGRFADYLTRKSENTRRAQLADLVTFSDYLRSAGVIDAPTGDDLQQHAGAWAGVTWGLVEGFVKWMLGQGYATGTVARKLSTVKVYAKLAMQADVISAEEYSRLATVVAYHGQEAERVDKHRAVNRTGYKKAAAVSLTDEQVRALKEQPDTPQGRRDRLLMCLLLDHGLRVGEVSILQVKHFNQKGGEMRFYRPKVGKWQTHKLTADTLRALHSYCNAGDVPIFQEAPLLRGSFKSGQLDSLGMSERAITKRVAALGGRVGAVGLSAHDCRHYWATRWAGKVDLFRLQEAGGWNSLAMPRRYTEAAKIANEGMA
jgi:integrase